MDELAATAFAAARARGVTRLADVTGLDRIGMPVWQAVRPWGRSLSVHQGKGLDAGTARLGACMEAIECSHAEAWCGPVITAGLADLPAAERAAAADDFAVARGAVDDREPLAWTLAERLDDGGALWVPAAAVSLDFTLDALAAAPPAIERTSNGQGAGFDLAFASYKALCEIIERDAFANWQAGTIFTRMADEIDLGSVGFPWFVALHRRCTELGIGIRAYCLPSIIGMPVVAAELHDGGGEAASHPHAVGTCAHGDPEAALRGAITEAVQARLTVIAGARDDLGLDHPQGRRPVFGFALALPGRRGGHDFAALWPGSAAAPAEPALAEAVAALARAGFAQAARLVLSPPQSPVISVRVFVPGLAAGRRTRRAPA